MTDPTQTLHGPVEVGHGYTRNPDGTKQLVVWVQLGDRRFTWDTFDDALTDIHNVFCRLGHERLRAEP